MRNKPTAAWRLQNGNLLSCWRYQCSRGFTLVELVVVIMIVGVIAAIAVPRFIALSRDARIASLTVLAAALKSSAYNVRAACVVSPSCDVNANGVYTIGGHPARLVYGWLDAGDNLNNDEIDAWVTYGGFTATTPNGYVTTFTVDGAPDPLNCFVNYGDANTAGYVGVTIDVHNSGC